MRHISYWICIVLFLQCYSCISQSDSVKTDSPSKLKKKGAVKPKTTPKKVDVLKDKKEMGGQNREDNLSEIVEKAEEEEMGLSIISYTNIEEKTTANLPVQGQKVKLMIQNNHSYAMWYLMPASGERTMPENGHFIANPMAKPPFFAKQYGKTTQKLVELIFYGQENQSFRAFYVEAGSSLLFRNYDLGTYKKGEYVPFWAIKKMVVDNNTPLEKWLPFEALSSPNVVVQNLVESGPIEWTNLVHEKDFLSKTIHFIQADGIKKYQIPVGVVR